MTAAITSAGRTATTSWGFCLPNRNVLFGGSDVPELLSLARTAEASGFFSSVWVGDSLLDRPRVEGNVLLAALAVATENISLGVSCAASFLIRDPVIQAIEWASIDLVSGGRTEWVICGGAGSAAELSAFGIERVDRLDRLEEHMALLPRLWTEDALHHEGRFHQYESLSVEPKPLQKPRPPLWYAVTPNDERMAPEKVDRALIRAIRYTDGWQGANTTADHVGRLVDRVQRLAADAGRDRVPCSAHIHLTIDDDPTVAFDDALWYFSNYHGQSRWGSDADAAESALRRMHNWGHPEEIAAAIRGFVDAGCDQITLRFAARDQPAQLQRFLDDVAPLLE